MLPGVSQDTPERVLGADLERCTVIHRLFPELILVCGRSSDMPCARAMLDAVAHSLLMAQLLVNTPAEQA